MTEYISPKFQLDNDAAGRVVEDAGAATFVTSTDQGLESSFAPVLVSDDRRYLRTHLAKANPWTRSIKLNQEVLAIFLAANSYVSPTNYPSCHGDHNVVPTWNYALAQIRATVMIRDDDEWKKEHVTTLSRHFERGRTPEWQVDDLDVAFLGQQLKGIVGIE